MGPNLANTIFVIFLVFNLVTVESTCVDIRKQCTTPKLWAALYRFFRLSNRHVLTHVLDITTDVIRWRDRRSNVVKSFVPLLSLCLWQNWITVNQLQSSQQFRELLPIMLDEQKDHRCQKRQLSNSKTRWQEACSMLRIIILCFYKITILVMWNILLWIYKSLLSPVSLQRSLRFFHCSK